MTESTLKTNNQEKGISHGDLDTGLFVLSIMDTTCILKIRPQERTKQLLNALQQKPLAPAYMIFALQVELTNLDSIYTSYKPLILMATQLLRKKPTFDGESPSNKHTKRSLLPFLGDAH